MGITQLSYVCSSIISPIIYEATSEAWIVGLYRNYISMAGFIFELAFIVMDYRFRKTSDVISSNEIDVPQEKSAEFLPAVKSFSKLFWMTIILAAISRVPIYVY